MNLRCAVISFVLVVGMIACALGNGPLPAHLLPASTVTRAPVFVLKADLSNRDGNVQAMLTIPRNLLVELAAGETPIVTPTPTMTERQSSLPWWATVITGVAMSLAMVLLVVKARSRKLKVVAATGVGLVLLAGGQLCANLAMPYSGPQTIEIMVVDHGEVVVLTLPDR